MRLDALLVLAERFVKFDLGLYLSSHLEQPQAVSTVIVHMGRGVDMNWPGRNYGLGE